MLDQRDSALSMPAYLRDPDFFFIRMHPKLGWEVVRKLKERLHMLSKTLMILSLINDVVSIYD